MMNAHSNHFYGHIENEVKRYLVTLLLEPARFHTNTRELTGRVMSRLAYDDASQGPRKGDTDVRIGAHRQHRHAAMAHHRLLQA